MEEKSFYKNNSVEVTNSKFIVGNKTYVLSNVTSIDIAKQSAIPAKVIGVIMLLIGLALISDYTIIGSIIGLLGLLLLFAKNQYSVILRTAGNENSAYSNTDKTEIEEIIQSLNDAVSSTGNTNDTPNEDKSSVADEIEKLVKLKESGALTEEEFKIQKEKILA